MPEPRPPPAPPRLARAEDGPAVLDLFGDVPMQGELVLATDRGPDFFSLYRMQKGRAELWLHESQGRLDAMGAMLFRDGWLDGAPARVGYLGDLRARFSAQ